MVEKAVARLRPEGLIDHLKPLNVQCDNIEVHIRMFTQQLLGMP